MLNETKNYKLGEKLLRLHWPSVMIIVLHSLTILHALMSICLHIYFNSCD